VLHRHDLTDEEWGRLEPLLPDQSPRRGGRWVDHRMILNGMFWRTRCGVPWRDVPPSFGSWKTGYNRHRRWSGDGTLMAADRRCRPISRVTSAGQRHDSLGLRPVLAGIRIRRRGPGLPRTRPGRVLGDKAYSSRAIRSYLRQRRIKATIPEPVDQRNNRSRRGSKGGRAPAFDTETYKQRNVVERAINKLKGHRAVAPATTNVTTRSAEPLISPRSGSGSATPSHDPRDRL
jgi:transposase